MANSTEQSYAYDQNKQRQRARLQAARSADAGHTVNDHSQNSTLNTPPQKGSIKAPRTITNLSDAKTSRAKLQQQQRATGNTPQGQGSEAQRNYAKDAIHATTGSKLLVPGKVISMAIQARKDIDDHKKAPWFLLYALALATDFLDLIPVFGWFFARMIQLFLFISLLGRGRFIKKKVMKLIAGMLIKFIPIINMIPSTTLVVAWIHHDSEKNYEKGKKQIKETKEAVPGLSV